MTLRIPLLVSAFALATLARSAAAQPAQSARVDHIIVGIDSLERGIRMLRDQTGVTPMSGGVHPGRGTQNALMSLGRGVYLELIAPNFADTAATPRVAFYSQFTSLVPFGWAVHTSNADSLAASAPIRGLAAGAVAPGSRADIRIPVLQGAAEGLQFDLDCPRGRVEFR